MSFLGNFVRQVHHAIFRRTSTLVLTALVLAYPFERVFDVATEKYFRQINKGKLYDDIKNSKKSEEEEEEE